MQRAAGRKTFIVTNSLYDYTNVVMNYLLEGRTGKDLSHDWLKYFDVVWALCPPGPHITQPGGDCVCRGATASLTGARTPIITAGYNSPKDPLNSAFLDRGVLHRTHAVARC
jgi:hypothetical protein